jgi:Phosphate-selective porin O and P
VLRRFLYTSIALLFLAVPRPTAAQVTPAAGYTPPDDSQSRNFGVTIFYDYTFNSAPKTTDADNNSISANAFQVQRTYINFTGTISHIVSFRITPDISRLSGSGAGLDGSYVVRLKYGFAQFNLTSLPSGSWVRLGLQQTPVVDYLEGVYRYRFQGTTMPDRAGLLTSSDNGASLHLNFANNYGDLQAGLFNGEGYGKAEANNEKAFQVRATVRPLAKGSPVMRGLRITGFYDGDQYIKSGDKKRALVDVTFEHAKFDAGGMYISAADQTSVTKDKIDSSGYSIWLNPIFHKKGDGFEGLLRFDGVKPNKNVDQTRKILIVGVAYWFPHPGGGATAAIMLDYDQQKFPGAATQDKIALHGLINF